MDTFDGMPAAGLSRIHMDPENPVPGGWPQRQTIRELPDEAIEAFVGVAGPGSGSPLLLTELRHLGGALGCHESRRRRPHPPRRRLRHVQRRHADDARSWARRSPATSTKIERDDAALGAARAPTSTSPKRPCDVDAILPADVCARLAEVKRQWDPEGTDRRQPLGLAGRGLSVTDGHTQLIVVRFTPLWLLSCRTKRGEVRAAGVAKHPRRGPAAGPSPPSAS